MRRLTAGTIVVLLTFAAGVAPSAAADADQDGVSNRRDRCPQLRGDRPDGCPTGAWRLRNSNTFGSPDVTFDFGSYAWQPVAGDWDSDGTDTSGVWDQATGRWRQFELPSGVDTFTFGPGAGRRFALVGDWDADGVVTVGIYDPSTGTFYLRNSNSTGPADVTFTFGGPHTAAEVAPVAGDWDGDGDTTVGLFVRSSRQWRLRNADSTGPPDVVFTFGPAGSIPVTGDWDANGTTTPGVVTRGSNLVWRLRNSTSSGSPDLQFGFGARTGTPVAGDWNGDGPMTVGVRRS
jgi:hypothetical protein